MKVIETQYTEPKIIIEMSLSEAKFLSEVLSSVVPFNIEQNLRQNNRYVHPNLSEKIGSTARFFTGLVKDTTEWWYKRFKEK